MASRKATAAPTERAALAALLASAVALLTPGGARPEPAGLPSLSASSPGPVPGEVVALHLIAPEGAPEGRWRGAEPDPGGRAARLVVPRGARPGDTLTVEVEGVPDARLVLTVQAARNEGPLPAPPLALRALPWVSGECFDRRDTRLAGDWALGCAAGVVDRAESLVDGARLSLEGGARAPGVAPGLLHVAGRREGTWRLPGLRPLAEGPRVDLPLVAPPATDGVRVALSAADAIVWARLDGRSFQRVAARPAPWYPPALAEGHLAWVQAGPPERAGEDLMVMAEAEGRPRVLAGGPAASRHVAGSGRWLAWIEDDAVWVQDLRLPQRRRHPADARSARALSLWGSVACWEQWNGQDVDVACSDGLVVERPGDQRGPSRDGPHLLFREGPQVLLATAGWLLLDDDDVRARPQGPRVADASALRGARVPAGVYYDVRLPEGAWQVERMGPEGWSAGELVSGGDLTLFNPWGDGLRLTGAPPSP